MLNEKLDGAFECRQIPSELANRERPSAAHSVLTEALKADAPPQLRAEFDASVPSWAPPRWRHMIWCRTDTPATSADGLRIGKAQPVCRPSNRSGATGTDETSV